MGLAHFKIDCSNPTQPEIEVNGQDILQGENKLQISQWGLKSSVGDVPRLFLEVIGEGELEGDGIVHVMHQSETDQDAILEFLNNLDAEELEKQVLDSLGGFGGPQNTGEAFLKKLKDIASGN